MADLFNQSLGLQINKGTTGNRGVNLHTIDQHSMGDQLVGGNLLEDLGIGFLVNDDCIVGLFLGLSLGPLLHEKLRVF